MRSRHFIQHLGCSCSKCCTPFYDRLIAFVPAASVQDSGEDDLDLVAVTIEKAGGGETQKLRECAFFLGVPTL